MWVFSTKGMYDLVSNRDRKGWMIIKARCKADIWNLYNEHHERIKMSKPVSDPLWDYRWGIHISKSNAQKLVAELVGEIDYSLFKGAVHKRADQDNKHRTYLQIWAKMLAVQNAEEAQQYRPSEQQHEPVYYQDIWQRELDYANDRFDPEPPIASKTIKSVTWNNHERD